MVLVAFAVYGPRILGQLRPRRPVAADRGGPGGRADHEDFTDAAANEAEMVQRAIAVLEEYLRRKTGVAEEAPDARATPSQIADRRPKDATEGRRQGNGESARLELQAPVLSESEALTVLGLAPGAEVSQINEAHRRLMQIFHPDRGGSEYFAVKLNQAKAILIELRAQSESEHQRRSAQAQQTKRWSSRSIAFQNAERELIMPQESKKPIIKDEITLPEVDLEQDETHRALATKQQVDNFRQRNAEVTETDREAFQDYLNRKAEAMPAAKAPPTAEQEPPPTKISRRGMLKAVVGTAGVGAAAWATLFRDHRRIGFRAGRQACGRSLHRSSTPQHRPPAHRSEGRM